MGSASTAFLSGLQRRVRFACALFDGDLLCRTKEELTPVKSGLDENVARRRSSFALAAVRRNGDWGATLGWLAFWKKYRRRIVMGEL
jgi:hypothetical protein